MKKYILVFLLLMTDLSLAVNINEIMYDAVGSDSGREWIEIYTDYCINLSEWKFYEEGTNHKINFVLGSQEVCDYAIISNDPSLFIADYPDFSGNLFKSSFSLKNTGEELKIKDQKGNEMDAIIYDPSIGAAGNGLSLQLFPEGWMEYNPTPGRKNIIIKEHEKNEQSENFTEETIENVTQEDNISKEFSNNVQDTINETLNDSNIENATIKSLVENYTVEIIDVRNFTNETLQKIESKKMIGIKRNVTNQNEKIENKTISNESTKKPSKNIEVGEYDNDITGDFIVESKKSPGFLEIIIERILNFLSRIF